MKLSMFALVLVGLLLLGCVETELGMKNMAMREVGIYGRQFAAPSPEELETLVFEECKYTCPGMDYLYEDTKYTMYEEDGMYIARDPKCICYDQNYADKHGTFLE